jgi:hypothetical protein
VKKINVLIIVFVAIAIALLPKGSAKAATAISTCEQLQDMNLNLSETYTLANDIDCTGTTSWDSGSGFTPVGNSGTPFTGSLDGQNHKIIGLFIDRASTADVGLFGFAQDASASNLTLQGGSITGQRNVGSIAGHIRSMNLSNINSSSTVGDAGYYSGGIIGFNESQSTFLTTLTNVHFSGSIIVSASSYSNAGLIGDNDADADIIQSSNTGTISGGYDYVGGLVGDNDAIVNITNSFNSGNITSKGSACCTGGLMGWADEVNITNSYNSGNVTGQTDVGGLVGFSISGSINNSYSTGLITGTSPANSGGIIGYPEDLSYTNVFWDTEISGQSVGCGTDFACAGTTGTSTSQMRTQTTFTDATWDFEKVWGICSAFNNGFPYLLWQNPSCTAPTPGLPNTGAGTINIDYSNTWAIDTLLKF